jgi:hypothetical protein
MVDKDSNRGRLDFSWGLIGIVNISNEILHMMRNQWDNFTRGNKLIEPSLTFSTV